MTAAARRGHGEGPVYRDAANGTRVGAISLGWRPDGSRIRRLVISGAPAPEGIPALVAACQAAGWHVVVFSIPAGTRFIDPIELERLTGEPVRSEYRMPGTGPPVPAADAVLACPLTFNSVNKFTTAMRTTSRPRSTSCWPLKGSARSWSATTRPPAMSSPSCSAVSTARRRQSCGRWRTARA